MVDQVERSVEHDEEDVDAVHENYMNRIELSGIRLPGSDKERKLPCELSDYEWEEAAQQAGDLFIELTERDKAEKERRKEWNEVQKDMKAEHLRLVTLVKNRTEDKKIRCRAYALQDSNEIVFIRVDNGEIAWYRAMTAEEIDDSNQQDMFARSEIERPQEQNNTELPPEV